MVEPDLTKEDLWRGESVSKSLGENSTTASSGGSWGNSVYLEWFSERNGRVVAESTHYEVVISERTWTMSDEQVRAQSRLNAQAMEEFMRSLFEYTGEELESTSTGSVKTEAEDGELDRALELMSEIEQLKANARDLAGGQMLEGSGEQPLPIEFQHQFWKNVVDFESAPRKTRREILAGDGYHAPPEQGLSDAELTHQLWRLIEALASRRTYLEGTDHLSDRELYRLLVERVLDEETEVLPPAAEWNCHVCIHEYGGPGGEDGTNIYLRYYADEEMRTSWAKEFPGEMPSHCDPPYDRDRFLPKGT